MNLKTVTGAAVELSETTFGREFNEALVHQVVTAYLAGARQGTRAKPQDWSQKVNRKMYRGAMQCILAELVRQERLVLVDSIGVDSPKTKGLVAKLAELNAPRALIVTHEVDENLYLAARNIPHVNVLGTREVDPVSLVSFDKVIMTVEAAKQFEETLA